MDSSFAGFFINFDTPYLREPCRKRHVWQQMVSNLIGEYNNFVWTQSVTILSWIIAQEHMRR